MRERPINIAFMYLESEDYDNKIFSTTVYEDHGQVILYDCEDGGLSITDQFEGPWKQGYYFAYYTYHNEQECWEMPSVTYPVIDSIEFKRCWYGCIYRIYLRIKFYITRTSKYHPHRKP